MDLTYTHGSQIQVVRACYHDESEEPLVAIAGEHSVDVLSISTSKVNVLASFHIGTPITALAWSTRSASPASSDEWIIEIAAAGSDYGLYLLIKTATSPTEHIFSFGGGLSGHHGRINDMTFCGGSTEDSARYLATVSDDMMLMVWDLHPDLDRSSSIPSPDSRSPSHDEERSQPQAYVIPFSHPLSSVSSHPNTSKELLIADSRGSLFLIDWRSDPHGSWRGASLIELVDPKALASNSPNSHTWGGSAAWRRDAIDIVGAAYGSHFSIWDVTKMGGKPMATSPSFVEGAHRFRWSPTYPDFFGISTQSPSQGAVLHIHNLGYVHASPVVLSLAPRPHRIRDFDFLATKGIPRIAAAVGKQAIIFAIGEA